MATKTRKPVDAPHDDVGLSVRDYRVLAEFRYLLAKFLAFSEAAAQGAGLSPRQHQALLAIKGFAGGPDVSVGDLAERLGIRHHSAVGLVDRLVASGYLLRRTDPTDRRRIFVVLTSAGEKKLAALSAIHRDELKRLTPLLKPLLSQLDAATDMAGHERPA
ncbi:MAG: MarR family transcriptional regulator [Alphaproteobacteria bacterium]|nr:MarR family transcriptional regulator [Alphaproteobacteria bacterium]